MVNNYSSDQGNSVPMNNNAAPAQGAPHAGASEVPATPPVLPETVVGGAPMRLSSGISLSAGRYKIEKLVASGGMGAVYRATDLRFNRPCAVKEMLDNFPSERERAQAVEWFSREATLLLDLNHSSIPHVRDFFAEGGRNYLVMDFIEGKTLADSMQTQGRVPAVNGIRGITEELARDWARQICGVLGYLHRQKPPIIFRDLKPQNIMVTSDNEIKLIDFGIARAFQGQQQATIIMTVGYAAPEQLHAMPEPRSDIFALGATLHRLLTGHDATNNKPTIFSFPPLRSLRPDLTPAFEQIVMKALSPNLDFRWPGADAMEQALAALPPLINRPQLPIETNKENVVPQASLTPAIPVQGTLANSGGVQHARAVTGVTGPARPHLTEALRCLSLNPPLIDAAYGAVGLAYNMEPNNALVHKLFGIIYARRLPRLPQNLDKAMQAYQRSLELDSNDAETHKLIGDVFLFLRVPASPMQAIAPYTQSLRLRSDDFEAHERLGQCFERTNQLDPAIREYQEALKLSLNQPVQVRLRLHFALGLIAFRAVQWPIAEAAFVQVLVLNNADHKARFMLSQVYERQGKLNEAFTQCNYVVGPLANDPAVQQLFFSLKQRLGR